MLLSEIVDLERYPIDRPQSRELQHVVRAVHKSLAANGCADLDGFVSPGTPSPRWSRRAVDSTQDGSD